MAYTAGARETPASAGGRVSGIDTPGDYRPHQRLQAAADAMPHAASESTLTRAASGYRATLVSQGVRLACKIVGVVVLARLVSPAEHGVFAMAASVMFFFVLFRDFGLTAAAIQA